MVHKKIFLIVLLVIIVGVVISAAINYFHNKAVQLNRNGVIKDLHILASDAQEYYKKPDEQGDAGKSFHGYKIPQELESNENGSYSIISAKTDSLVIKGTGFETREQNFSFNWGEIITYEIIILPDSTKLRKVY